MNVPVLFIVFNRIETTEKVFEKIRQVKPKKLYIAADGPRKNKLGELEKCEEVRQIVDKVDWDCCLYTEFQTENLGCKLGVYTAINWFFENEDQGIILEDDVVPLVDFFSFCEQNLLRYKENKKVFTIQGFNQFGQNISSNEYYFSRGYYAWGWATWRDRWEEYKLEITKEEINSIYKNNNYPKYVLSIIALNLELVRSGILDTWDYQMVYHTVSSNSFNIVPIANLTSNIGVDGAHSNNNKNIFHDYGNMDVRLLKHPDKICESKHFNDLLWKEFDNARIKMYLRRLILKMGIYKQVKAFVKKWDIV